MEGILQPGAAAASRRAALRISVLYLGAAIVWIVGSDYLALELARSGVQLLVVFQLAKGALFITGTAALLYWLTIRATRRMAERDVLLEVLESSAQEAVFLETLRPARRVDYVSPAVSRLMGYTPAEFQADPDACLRITVPEDRERCAALASAEPAQGQVRVLRKDGSSITTLQQCRPIFQNGDWTGVVRIVRDISHEVERDEERRHMERRFVQVVDRFPGCIALVTNEEKASFVNAVCKQMLAEHTRGEHLPRVEDLAALPGLHALPELLKLARETGETQTDSARPAPADLEAAQIFHTTVAPLRDAQGRLLETAILAVDITETARMRAQLDQAGRLALLGEMAAGIAHEINQPLTIIRMASQLIDLDREQLTDPETRHQIDAIITAVDRAANIISHMRSLVGGHTEKMQFVRLDEIVRAALTMANFRLREANAACEFAAPEEPVWIFADPLQIEQVLINILLNAADALLENEHDRRIRIQAIVDASSKAVRLKIFNNGPPIPADLESRIFAPFVTTKPPGKGAGLGLSVSNAIIREHNGRLTAHNAADGVEFCIDLPLSAGTKEES